MQTKPMTSDSEDKYQPLDTEVERSKFHASVRANTTAHSELAQEAQSEAPSVDSQIDEVFDWLLASYVDTDNVYIIEEMEEDRPIFKAKINRLIVEARIDQIKSDMAWQFINEADLFKYIEHQQSEVKELSNNLSKGE